MAKATLQAKKDNKVTKTVQTKRSNIMENKKQTKPVQKVENQKSEKVVELKKATVVKAEPKPKTEQEKNAELEKEILTNALKSNKNFEEYLKQIPVSILSEIGKYPAAENNELVKIVELTQNKDSFFNLFTSEEYKEEKSYIILWIVNSIKDELVNFAKILNEKTSNSFGIFVFKADLNNNKMNYECVVRPVMKQKSRANGNDFNLAYWTQYYEIAKACGTKIVAKPNDRQFKTISAGKTGVAIMQTVSREQLRLGSEIYIQNDKKIYDKLFEHKAEIEKVVGPLEWLRLDNKKASRVVKYINADLLDNNKIKNAINEQIKTGEQLKAIVSKFI